MIEFKKEAKVKMTDGSVTEIRMVRIGDRLWSKEGTSPMVCNVCCGSNNGQAIYALELSKENQTIEVDGKNVMI